MFIKIFKLFSVGRFKICVDVGAAALFAILVLSFNLYFSEKFPAAKSWASSPLFLSAVSAFIFLGFALIHELSHAAAASLENVKTRDEIIFWVFGAALFMEETPPKPKSELKIALAGPLSNLVSAGLLHLASGYAKNFFAVENNPAVFAVIELLVILNVYMAVFNLIPAFPMDGGRILRAIVWRFSKDIINATKFSLGITEVLAGVAFFYAIWTFNFMLAVAAIFIVFGAKSELAYLKSKKEENEKNDETDKTNPDS